MTDAEKTIVRRAMHRVREAAQVANDVLDRNAGGVVSALGCAACAMDAAAEELKGLLA